MRVTVYISEQEALRGPQDALVAIDVADARSGRRSVEVARIVRPGVFRHTTKSPIGQWPQQKTQKAPEKGALDEVPEAEVL